MAPQASRILDDLRVNTLEVLVSASLPAVSTPVFVTPRLSLTSVNLAALFATPFQLVAGVANKGIIPIRIALEAIDGTIPYNLHGSTVLYVHYNGDLTHLVDIPTVGFMDQTSSDLVVDDGFAIQTGPLAKSVLKGTDLQLSNDVAAFTTGNGTLNVTVWYVLVDLS